MMFQTGSPGLARRALDALLDPCAVLRPVRDEHGAVTDFVWLDANAAAVRVQRSGVRGVRRARLRGTAARQGHARACSRTTCAPWTVGTAVDRARRRVRRRGARRAVHAASTSTPCRSVAICSCRWHDSSERHEQADALAKSERRFRILAEHASDVVLETAPDGSIVWVSPTLHDVLGYDGEAWLGRRPRRPGDPRGRRQHRVHGARRAAQR